jgi:ABC-2 type transport system ATP-binding protein
LIEVQELSRRYGDFTAVDRVSFAVEEGEIVGILGPNGAGKTTIIRMVTGFLPPTGGRVTVAGKDLFTEPRRARRDIGYLPENVALYPEMRVAEYLAYRARLEGMARADARGALDEAVDRALLAEVRGQVIGTLSKGYRQRVALAAAILHRPRVLVLDEPTVGLDPRQIIAIRELIRELGQKRTLLLSTHILPEVELLCDRVLIIDRGRIVAHGTPAELTARSRGRRTLRVELGGAGADAAARLAGIPGVAAVTAAEAPAPPAGPGSGSAEPAAEPAGAAAPGGAVFRLEVADGADPREAVFRAAVELGWVLLGMAEERASLEDVFVRLTTYDEAAAGVAAPPQDPEPPEPAPPAEEDAAGEGGEEVPS